MASKWVLLTDDDRAFILATKVPASLRKKIEGANKRIKVSSARGKGMGFQKWICAQLSLLLNIPYNQSDDESLIASRPSGGHKTDIILRGRAKQVFPFSIEAKAQENMNLVDTIEQAKTNTEAGTSWMVVHKRKALSEPVVIVGWKTFTELYKKVLDTIR